MRQIENPEPEELTYTPEIASLATLDAVLEIAVSALMSSHPELNTGEIPLHTDPQASLVWLGGAIIGEARMLQKSIQMYREAVELVHEAAVDDMEQDS
jgi:hypothetical protein